MSRERFIRAALQSSDPTNTLGIRVRWINETSRRFNKLKRLITKTIKNNDALRLKERNRGEEGQPGRGPRGLAALLQAATAFVFTRDDQAIDQFMAWLQEQEKENVLEIIQRPDLITGEFGEPWTNTYIRNSYQKGLADANKKLAAAGASSATQTAAAAMAQPFNIDRLRLVYTRVFTELEGITATMNAGIRRELTRGLAEGLSPTQMAQRIVKEVEGIGETRAKLIARTETILAHNEANLNEYKRASGIIGEDVLVEWITAGGPKVRPKHRRRSGEVFTQAGYASRIGEPNCRCSGVPYIVSIEGEPKRIDAVP